MKTNLNLEYKDISLINDALINRIESLIDLKAKILEGKFTIDFHIREITESINEYISVLEKTAINPQRFKNYIEEIKNWYVITDISYKNDLKKWIHR